MDLRKDYSLSTQFLSAAAIILLLSMVVLGTWMTRQITRSVLATAGEDGAAFMHGIVQPKVQRLSVDGTLHPDDVAALDRLFVGSALSESIVSVKIWSVAADAKATVLYSSLHKDSVGQQFVLNDAHRASSGQIFSEFQNVASPESLAEHRLSLPLIEIYAPLFRAGTNEIIAVGEIYEDATILAQQLRQSVVRTWLVVCTTTLATLGVLYLIVRRGNRLILEQRAELKLRVSEAEQMAAQNQALRLEADRSRLDANEANEELLGRIGLDIHDGPIQLLSLTRLRLDEIRENIRSAEDGRQESDLGNVVGELSQVIHELRDLSVGLVLPELRGLSAIEAVAVSVERHEQLTGTKVHFESDSLPDELPDAIKICLYRVVQESLSNAFKHAGGLGQCVTVTVNGSELQLTVSDSGAANGSAPSLRNSGPKLGWRGIANRVAAFGGSASIHPIEPTGTRVFVSIPLTAQARRTG